MSHHIAVTTGRCSANIPAPVLKEMLGEVKAVHKTMAPLEREVLFLDKGTDSHIFCVFGLTLDLPLEMLEREVQEIVDNIVSPMVELVYNKPCS